MAREALELMHRERWGDAQSLLARAYQFVEAPTIAVLEGQALEKMGRLVDAIERYQRASRSELDDTSPAPYRDAVEKARSSLDRLAPKIPVLHVLVRGASDRPSRIAVRIDGKQAVPGRSVRQRIDPGEHVVAVSVDEKLASEKRVFVQEGETERIVFELPEYASQRVGSESPRSPSSGSTDSTRTVGWVLVGMGAVGVTVGATAGAMMLNAKDDLDAGCGASCPRSLTSTLSRFRTTRVVSAVGYVSGVLGLATGAGILVLSSPKSTPQTGWNVWSDARVVGVEGSF